MRSLLFASLLVAGAPAGAEELAFDLHETVFKLSTTVKGANRKDITGDMIVTQYTPDGDGPFPIAVILHGRSATDRSKPERQRYTQSARYFVRRGFAVWVPTRLGYGDAGIKPDPENSGSCDNKNYPVGFEAAATSTLDVIAYARKQPFADPTRIVVLGQSYGGATAIALAAKNPPGLLGVINFSGGGGGNPDTMPGNPCGPERLQNLFGSFGKTTRIPTLWLYAENDKYFGSTYPKQWYGAYEQAGGTGEFKALPPFGDDGHQFFGRAFDLWRPMTDAFLMRLGFAPPKSPNTPPATQYAQLGDVAKLPLTGNSARDKYAQFLKMDLPRAFAIGPRGEFGYSSAMDATTRALTLCRQYAKTACKLYAVDDQIVWKP